MKFFKEFKEFINKGNALDLAIGLVIGTAFNAIVQSLVKDIIMPLVSALIRTNISDLKWVIIKAVTDPVTGDITKAEVAMAYGNFIQQVVNFFIIALSIFVAIKVMVSVKKKVIKANELIFKKKEAQEETTEAMEAKETETK